MEICKICSEKKYYLIEFNNLFIRTDSYKKDLHQYQSKVCYNCGVVYQSPQISEKVVTKHYQTNARKTNYPLNLDDNIKLDFPFQFEQTGISFQRFYHFYKIINKTKKINKNLDINSNTCILDYGAYQGAFLYACKKIWNPKTIAYDYNESGLKFATNFLDIDHIFHAKNISEDIFPNEINICVAIQVLEHLPDPVKFLNHVKKNVLKNKGFIYIEVPCAETSEYSNPSHLFMFTKESLEYLFNLCGFEIHHISIEHIHNFPKLTTLKRHIQTMVHCLASANEEITFNKNIFIGKKIYKRVKKSHLKSSNKIYHIKLLKFLKDAIIVFYYGFFVIISFLSQKFSFTLFLFFNNFLKKIKFLNKLSRK